MLIEAETVSQLLTLAWRTPCPVHLTFLCMARKERDKRIDDPGSRRF
jgi:hypothetical protein